MDAQQELELSVRSYDFVAYYLNVVYIKNKTTYETRKLYLSDEKKIDKNSAKDILLTSGINRSKSYYSEDYIAEQFKF